MLLILFFFTFKKINKIYAERIFFLPLTFFSYLSYGFKKSEKFIKIIVYLLKLTASYKNVCFFYVCLCVCVCVFVCSCLQFLL